MKNLNEEVNKIKHLFNFKKGDVITEDSEIDYEGITIGDMTIYKGDSFGYPSVKSMGVKAHESGRPNSLSITVNLRDNVKNIESLLQNTLGYNPDDYGTKWVYDEDEMDYVIKDKTKPYKEDFMSMSNLPCTFLGPENIPVSFVPTVKLSFTKKGDTIDLTDVKSFGWRCRSARCSPLDKDVDECNKYMAEMFKEGFGLPKKINELDPKFVNLFGE